LATIADIARVEVDRGLKELVESGLISQRGEADEAAYTFKHTLVQDAAYESLSRLERISIHQRIVKALEAVAAVTDRPDPALLALHCERAGYTAWASEHFVEAANSAMDRVAYAEARAHYDKARALIEALPESAERDRRRLDVLVGRLELALKQGGFFSPDLRRAGSEALALWERLGTPREYTGLVHFLQLADIFRLRLDSVTDFLAHLRKLQTAPTDAVIEPLVRTFAGIVLALRGRLEAARDELEAGEILFARHDDLAALETWWTRSLVLHPNAIRMLGQGHLMLILPWLGYPDRAARLTANLVELSQGIDPIDARHLRIAFQIGYGLFVHDPPTLRTHTEESLAWLRKHELTQTVAMGSIALGHARVGLGEIDQGCQQMREGLALYELIGSRLWGGFFLSLLADGCARGGDFEAAMELLDEAESLSEETGEARHRSILHRTRGEIALSRAQDAAAVQAFERALTLARDQKAKLFELQAATSYARMLRDRGRVDAARAILVPVYRWFTEGFGTHPLREAASVLASVGVSSQAGRGDA
jgi:tetratricopeptide (TPR) repeat protein